MAAATDKRSERTQARLTDAHLLRLSELADQDHTRFTRPAREGGNLSAWRNRRVAVVLAHGAARHYLHPRSGHGVKDLDVWTFYAARPSTPLRSGRYETHAHFGPSSLDRNTYPLPLVGERKAWDAYQGRRMDFLVRGLPVRLHADEDEIIRALRVWLEAGAAQPCQMGTRRNSSAHHLAHKAMVWIGTPATRQYAGRRVWDIDDESERFPHLIVNPHCPSGYWRLGAQARSIATATTISTPASPVIAADIGPPPPITSSATWRPAPPLPINGAGAGPWSTTATIRSR